MTAFDTTKRFFAFSPATLQSATALRNGFGKVANTAPDHNGVEVKTLLCALDNVQTGKFRALELGVTAIPLLLADGRYFLGGFWSVAAIDAFESGEIQGSEITVNEIKLLTQTQEL